MKAPVFVLAAASALGFGFATPEEARAGNLHVDIHLGFPAVVYHPRVIYAPAVVYRPHVVYRPYVRHRHRIHHHDRHHHHRHVYRGGYHKDNIWVHEQRVIRRIDVNPRLHGR